jgi:hypothetical protein
MFRMSSSPFGLRSPAARMVTGAGVAIACLGALITGVAASAAATAPAAAGKASAPRQAAAAKLDHQLCYTATGQIKVPNNVKLINQFVPKGFAVKIGKIAVHCNPVTKILPTGASFPAANPRAHLLCLTISAARQASKQVIVTNQFGSDGLITGQPNLLCLPSWKSLTGPPKQSAPQPPGLSHFTCYPVKLPAGTAGYQPPNPIMLKDEFAPKPVQVRVSPVPQELCLPTEKIIGNHDFKIVNPVTHLLCFPVTKTPIVPRIWDQNQFGTAELAVHTTKWLCLPSTKRVVLTPGR